MTVDTVPDSPRRSYWQAGLYGALVPMVLGTVLLMGFILVGHYRSVQTIMPPAEAFFLFLAFLFQAGIVAFPTAYALTGFMALIEQRAPKPLLLWLLLSLVVTTPVAFVAWVFSHMGDCFENCRAISELEFSAPAILVYACGMLGAGVARRVRHGSLA